jgi:hypothetical protein
MTISAPVSPREEIPRRRGMIPGDADPLFQTVLVEHAKSERYNQLFFISKYFSFSD